jgi:hypothetical protein
MLQLPATIPRFFQNKADDLLTYLTLKYLEVVVKAIKELLIKTVTRKIEIKKPALTLNCTCTGESKTKDGKQICM